MLTIYIVVIDVSHPAYGSTHNILATLDEKEALRKIEEYNKTAKKFTEAYLDQMEIKLSASSMKILKDLVNKQN